ncbi:MAG: type IV pilus modification protein PilV [Stagnimonas sp.]|nr:type IV pilus modification protein PilV [Stagnimonas sp.]
MPASQAAVGNLRVCRPVLRASAGRQRGVGLVEVLVAVVVLSVGLLGISLVQTRALTNNSSSMGRSMAVMASYSILEAMRADRANAIAAALPYNTTVTASSCPTATATLANVQLRQWCLELGNRFRPVSTTTGTVTCNTAAVCTIAVQFDDSRGSLGDGSDSIGTSTTEQVVTRAAL